MSFSKRNKLFFRSAVHQLVCSPDPTLVVLGVLWLFRLTGCFIIVIVPFWLTNMVLWLWKERNLGERVLLLTLLKKLYTSCYHVYCFLSDLISLVWFGNTWSNKQEYNEFIQYCWLVDKKLTITFNGIHSLIHNSTWFAALFIWQWTYFSVNYEEFECPYQLHQNSQLQYLIELCNTKTGLRL